MQRPARIMVFGVLCLLFAVVSGLHNLMELALVALGPAAVPASTPTGGGEGFGQMMADQNAALRHALEQPAYRLLMALDAMAGALMAVGLATAGVGLFMDKFFALKLARVWAYFALVSAVVTVVINARFVMPHVASAPPGSTLAMGTCMLPILWLFPILVLTVLCRNPVTDYLRHHSARSVGTSPAHALSTPVHEASQAPSQATSSPGADDLPPPGPS